jgi:hypothetical protein
MLEGELADAYDYVSPCFPPHYNIFDSIFQLYHVQFAQVGGGPSVNACWRGKCGMLCELHDCQTVVPAPSPPPSGPRGVFLSVNRVCVGSCPRPLAEGEWLTVTCMWGVS